MSTPRDRTADLPLRGTSILITRSAEDAIAMRARLEALGASVLELATIEIVPPLDAQPLDKALRTLAHYHWIAFSSRHAVHAVCRRLPDLGLSVGAFPLVAAVGPSTARELRAQGVDVQCQPEEATANDLALALIYRGIEGKLVLLPVGDLARQDLSEALRAAGASVDVVIAYRTVQPLESRRASLDALRRGGVDIVALASPSAVHSLVTMLGSAVPCLQYVKLVCIGPATAAAVSAQSLVPAAIAREHTLDGLVQAIVEVATEGETR